MRGVPISRKSGADIFPDNSSNMASICLPTGKEASVVIEDDAPANNNNFLTVTFKSDGDYTHTAGNDWALVMSDTRSSGNEVADFDVDTRTLTIEFEEGGSTLAEVKAAIDALADTPFDATITGAGGSTVADAPADPVPFTGGFPDNEQHVTIMNDQDVYIVLVNGSNRPADVDDNADFINSGKVHYVYVPPGYSLWTQSKNNQDQDGSWAVWESEDDINFHSF